MNTTSRSASGFCFLKDQQPLSAAAFQHARQLCEQLRTLIAGRRDYLQRRGRNPAIHLPHGNWELGSELYTAYKVVVDGDYTILNNLRLFSQMFTGYQLLSLAGSEGLPIPRAVPPDLDERLVAFAGTPGAAVAAYLDITAHLPEQLHLTPPNVFGEIGWLVEGEDGVVNHDTNVYLERLVLLAESGKLWELRHRSPALGCPRILEIGSGYGGLAHALFNLIPRARYYLVDIPESLLFSSIYLSTLWSAADNVLITPDNLADLNKDTPGFTFVPNFLFDDCCAAGLKLDLAINTLSMSEMTEEQVRYYCRGLAGLLGERGVFFEQNQDNRPVGLLDAKTLIAEHFRYCLPLKSFILPVTQGAPHLWADAPLKPYAWVPSTQVVPEDPPRLIEEGFLGVNIIYYHGLWYGLPQGSGAFDPLKIANRQYAESFTANSKDQLKEAIRLQRG